MELVGANGFSRQEVEDAVWPAFAKGCPTRAELVRAARRKAAPPALVALLERLPGQEFGQLSRVWDEIQALPRA